VKKETRTMFKKKALAAVAAVTLTAFPALSMHATTAHAAIRPDTTSGCGGPVVTVYGSSALRSFIVASSQDYCNTFSNKTTAPDVEYQSGGDSCPGVDFAADHPGADDVGASDVFAPACTGGAARPSSSIQDNVIAVNVVDSIAQCPGANDLQGSSPHAPAPDVPCVGNGSGQNNQTFTAPNNESVQTAQLLWSSALGDYAQAGGTANNPPTVQQRIPGSGTRATWCQNLYGPGNDQCVGNATNANTTGDELTAVCGNPYASGGPAAPTDGANAIGYATRAALVVDPRQPGAGASGLAPLAGCGIVNLNGLNGYNGRCDPTNIGAAPAGTVGTNPESSASTCNGDLQVATGQYPVWGYEHLDLNPNAGANARAYVNFVNSALSATSGQQAERLQQQGFIKTCQMEFVRGADAGPYSASTGATC